MVDRKIHNRNLFCLCGQSPGSRYDSGLLDVPIVWTDLEEHHRGHSNVVFAILASLLEGRALALLKTQKFQRN
jgi:hypothetical protein